jgi:hypothetical protein
MESGIVATVPSNQIKQCLAKSEIERITTWAQPAKLDAPVELALEHKVQLNPKATTKVNKDGGIIKPEPTKMQDGTEFKFPELVNPIIQIIMAKEATFMAAFSVLVWPLRRYLIRVTAPNEPRPMFPRIFKYQPSIWCSPFPTTMVVKRSSPCTLSIASFNVLQSTGTNKGNLFFSTASVHSLFKYWHVRQVNV